MSTRIILVVRSGDELCADFDDSEGRWWWNRLEDYCYGDGLVWAFLALGRMSKYDEMASRSAMDVDDGD